MSLRNSLARAPPPKIASRLETRADESVRPFSLLAPRRGVSISRQTFVDLVQHALLSLGYSRPKQLVDFSTACRIRERRDSVTILLCGTSGCGKSTLASLLASRLGIHSMMSTDSVRGLLRSFDTKRENHFIWSSTYEAGAILQGGVGPSGSSAGSLERSPSTNHRKAVIQGYKAQSEMVLDHLSNLIDHAAGRGESLIIEGVHLSVSFMIQLMRRNRNHHHHVLPFLLYISNEQKHKERFAVRARAMALTRSKNKYVNNFRNIRIIQDYLCKKADKYLVPKIDNSNIDRSVAAIHTILLGCLRSGEIDASTDPLSALHDEYEKLNQGHVWGGKDMLQLIRQKKTVDISVVPGVGATEAQGASHHKAQDELFYARAAGKKGRRSSVDDDEDEVSSGEAEGESYPEEEEDEDDRGGTSAILGMAPGHVSDAGSILESHEDRSDVQDSGDGMGPFAAPRKQSHSL